MRLCCASPLSVPGWNSQGQLSSQALFVCSAGVDEEGWGQQGWLVLLLFPS